MSNSAQISANQANAQHSTGPVTDTGKAASSQNRRIHPGCRRVSLSAISPLGEGFTGRFGLMKDENGEEYTALIKALYDEHQPATVTESILVEKMAQHFWTAQRAIRLQSISFGDEDHPKQLALYLRYQTTHDRAFHKCLSDLLKLRAERRKALESEKKAEIGFESQKRKEELHEARVRLLNAQAENKEMDTDIRGGIEAPLPGHVRIPYDALKRTVKEAFREAA
ncbi:MAG TPA: hypothetical protein VHZ07_06530 [Bryobacteraceae bacterium]|jgi:hypothetical protein|nr:hypothetical protein [Bryobacteraceae bacterium]